jgi:hypothetical protein
LAQAAGGVHTLADMTVLPVAETIRRTKIDREMLRERVAGQSDEVLTAEYLVNGQPLGDTCESLRDLVAHVLMWDEINLAVLSEARRGRAHWSLDPRWESREIGYELNRSGVLAGRRFPISLLLHRFASVCDAMLAELGSYDDREWIATTTVHHASTASVGALAQYVMTVPQVAPYWHAAHHLGEVMVSPTCDG